MFEQKGLQSPLQNKWPARQIRNKWVIDDLVVEPADGKRFNT